MPARFVRLLELRREQPAFHPDATQQILELGEQLFCFERTAVDGAQQILVLANLTAQAVELTLDHLPTGLARREELLAINDADVTRDTLRLEPYAVFWFSQRF